MFAKFKKFRELPAAITISVVAASCLIAGVIAVSLLSQDKPDHAVVRIETVNDNYIPGTLDALMRTFAIDQACHDKANNVYFYRIPEHKPIEGFAEQGWYLLPKAKFLKLQNGTYVVTETSGDIQATPDTTGLQCKTQPIDPDWFRERK